MRYEGTEQSFLGAELQGRYRVSRVIGRGGMGTVFLAVDLRLGRAVVIKVPRSHVMRNPRAIERFRRETRSLAKLLHPNIVRVHDAGMHEGIPYLVMEHLDRGSLADTAVVRVDSIGDGHVYMPWLHEIADALDYLHRRQVVHRDVKPTNILFDLRDSARLSDFGIVKIVTGPKLALTAPGQPVGSLDFASPEQVAGQKVSPASDQYALASAVFWRLSGRLPHEEPNNYALAASKLERDAPELNRLAPEIPEAVSAAVARALARPTGDRFPSCRLFAAAVTRGWGDWQPEPESIGY